MPRPDSTPPAGPLDGDTRPSRAVPRRRSRPSTARRLPLRTLRVSTVLAYTNPSIWRRLELASDLRLDGLHRVLQAAFEWEGGHLHQFSVEDRSWDDGSAPDPFSASAASEPESKTCLSQVLAAVGDQLVYVYDFGDSWEHVVLLEEIAEPKPGAARARVVGGERAAPLEDCGGVPGYEDLVTALSDPKRSEHADVVEWYAEVYGGSPADFDPAQVDIEALDQAVQRIAG
jgi:Plasmid pRiA4b ORF-3-like protein